VTHQPLYVTVGELKSAIQLETNTADADVARALHAASRAIEKVTSRRFWLDDEPTVERYTALSTDMVIINDAAEIDSVSINGVEMDAGNWFAEPTNNPAAIGEPYLWIESDSRFPLNRQAIEVTGKFGWPEVPDAVKQIVIVTANKALKRTREAPWGIVGSQFDGLSLRITRDDPDLQLYVEPLMRAETRRSR
jgi:hypothetical protein